MWKWLDRRKHSRRDEDLRARFDEAIQKKKDAAAAAIERMDQYRVGDRRFGIEEYHGPERRQSHA